MIPVMIPHVPTVAELLPYLSQIDLARWYTNRGPLVVELEKRLSETFGAHAVTVSSGTAGLELALAVQGHREVTAAAYGFRATLTAAWRQGILTHLRDVNPYTGKMSASESARSILTCAYGAPYTDASATAIVDAAGAFGNQRALDCPVVFSMHATKALTAGEGGFVVTKDARFAAEIRRLSNFGFQFFTREREAHFEPGPGARDGTNAKLSEYHAAVALASLDAWPETRVNYGRRRGWYFDCLPDHVKMLSWDTRPLYSTLLPVKLPCSAAPVAARLAKDSIQTRRWYECFSPLPVAKELADRVLGLPFYYDIERSTIEYVCAALAVAIEEVQQGK